MGSRLLAAMLVVIGFSQTFAFAGDAPSMLFRQSHNTGIQVVPARGEVTIDGRLDEWDRSGRIWSFADIDLRDRFSTQTSMMWDEQHLYVAIEWRDPTPMNSKVDPAFDPSDGWKADSVQFRVRTDHVFWITTWYYQTKNQAVMHLSRWVNPKRDKDGQDITLLVSQPGESDLGRGARMAYRKADDGQGFVQEMAIPWALLYKQPPPIRPGLTPKIGLEFLWSDATGQLRPIHRYADNLQPDATSRQFFWTATDAWGDAKLVATNDVVTPTYVAEADRPKGTIPIRAVLPPDASRFTIAIEDADGRRIRNLAGNLLAVDFQIEAKDNARTVQVMWDGLDDRGKLVSPGEYRIRGLVHAGIGAEFDSTFYNPGNPPWHTADGTGAWGGNHTAPGSVAAAGPNVIIGWPGSEGGHALIALNERDEKIWGELRGAKYLAANAQDVYAYRAQGRRHPALIFRVSVEDGSYRPFVKDGEARPFDLHLSDVFDQANPGQLTGMALHGDRLVVGRSTGQLAVLDAQSAEPVQQMRVEGIGSLAFGHDGRLYAIAGHRLHEVDLDRQRLRPIPTPGLAEPGALAVDHDGNIVVFDQGPDSQLKAYSPKGELVFAAGRKGGRPVRGRFIEQAMMQVSDVAVDARGRLWVTENWNYPRRVSVWSPNGRLVRDFIGNTGYGSTRTFLHDQDADRAYVGPIEMKLDRERRTYEVTQVLWSPRPGEPFEVNTASHAHPHVFRSAASGRTREYMFDLPYRGWQPYVLFMKLDDGSWRPVSALGRVEGLVRGGDAPGEVLAGLDAKDGFYWYDANSNARIERKELTIVPAEQDMATESGWGTRMSPDDLSFILHNRDHYVQYSPVRFDADGAPIYGPGATEKLDVPKIGGRQDLVPVPGEPTVVNVTSAGGASPESIRGINPKTGRVLWTYPNVYAGVHGSHKAPMPKPGLVIGSLKVNGVAHVNEQVGNVFAIRGNMGVDYILTTDGLFVAQLFRDSRLPAESLPGSVDALIGRPLNQFSQGAEPFSGWFAKQKAGKIRLGTSLGGTAALVVQVTGLDTIRRFVAEPVIVDRATLAAAQRANIERESGKAESGRYLVRRVESAPSIDGRSDDWNDVPSLPIKSTDSPFTGQARLVHDGRSVYVLFEVNDPSPWLNRGKDYHRLFKTGDAVDLQLATNAKAPGGRNEPAQGDLRVLIAPLDGKPTAVLMQPEARRAPGDARHVYSSPVGDKEFDRVELLSEARTAVAPTADRYVVEVAIPLTAIGLKYEPGMYVKGDLGFISSNTDGTRNTARTYWANKRTNLTSDEPLEAWLYPQMWGELKFE